MVGMVQELVVRHLCPVMESKKTHGSAGDQGHQPKLFKNSNKAWIKNLGHEPYNNKKQLANRNFSTLDRSQGTIDKLSQHCFGQGVHNLSCSL